MPDEPKALCISLHDVAPATWPACQRLLDRLDRLGDQIGPLALTLLVVPCYRGRYATEPTFIDALRQRITRGDELALHGWMHQDTAPAPTAWPERIRRRIYTDAEGEFAAISSIDAAQRILAGREWFQRHGFSPQGFVPPAYLLGTAATEAVVAADFQYIGLLSGILRLPERKLVASWPIMYSSRSAPRRAGSLMWNAMRWTAQPIVRVGLHPIDIEYPRVMAQVERLTRALVRTHRSRTKADAMACLYADQVKPKRMI